MFDLGWGEIVLISIACLIFLGPKEIPKVVRAISGFFRKIRGHFSDFQDSMEDIANMEDIKDIKKNLTKGNESLRKNKLFVEEHFNKGFNDFEQDNELKK